MAALVSLAGFITTYVLGVRTLAGQTAENAILSNAHFVYEQPILALVSTPSLLLSCGMLAVIGYAQGRTRETTAGVVTVGVSNLLTQVLKHFVLDRPALVAVGENTFPSGHMTAFASIAVLLIVVAPQRTRLGVSVTSSIALAVVGALLLRSGWHRLSDVVGAVMLVTLISALTQAVAAKQTGRPAATRGAVIVFASLSAPTAALASVAFIMQVQGLAPLSMNSPLIGGSIAIASVVLAAVAAHLWFLPRSSTSGNASARRHAVEPE